jgi:hypothetical protein
MPPKHITVNCRFAQETSSLFLGTSALILQIPEDSSNSFESLEVPNFVLGVQGALKGGGVGYTTLPHGSAFCLPYFMSI